jgi:CDP-glucose 4,6-dehydratase
VEDMVLDPAFWHGRRVLLTGHTGFKGSWLSLWLSALGAHVTGFSDAVPGPPSLFEAARVAELVDHRTGDARDREAVAAAVRDARPEVVLHLAAQPFVRRSFREPVETYATNVMGTVHVLDAVRQAGGVLATVIVTSDKCYDNREQGRPFTEADCMGGHDPYSNSKGAAELVTDAYRRSYELPVASGRAGNVIGGGDWGEDRLIPDMMRGALAGAPIPIRRPDAVRPWQHVLNPLSGYLLLAQALATGDHQAAEGWNFGPPPGDAQPVSHIVEQLTRMWPGELRWEIDPGPHPHEASYLALDSTKARERLGWAPAWGLEQALASIVGWFVAYREEEDMRAVTHEQIDAFQAAWLDSAR